MSRRIDRIRTFTLACAAVVAAGRPVFAGQPPASILEQLRASGGVERIVVWSDRVVPVPALVAEAELIIEASTSTWQTHVSADQMAVVTDYTFSVHEVFKRDSRLLFPPGAAVAVRRESGEVTVDGRVALVHENNFPLFAPGERYLLFLARRDGFYEVVGGAQGAFRVAGESVISAGAPSEDTQPVPALTRAALVGEMRALLGVGGQ